MSSRVQSVVFQRGVWTLAQASAWLRSHGITPVKPPRREKGWLRYRIEDPLNFSRFTTQQLPGVGIHLILGWP